MSPSPDDLSSITEIARGSHISFLTSEAVSVDKVVGRSYRKCLRSHEGGCSALPRNETCGGTYEGRGRARFEAGHNR